MNDLTKEELKFISEHLEFSLRYNGLNNNGFANDLQDKLQSLIDNHCDHDYEYGCRGCSKCKKCQRIIE